MPLGGLGAEAVVEALEEGLGERDLGQQDQHLLAGRDRGGDRFEVDLGLAGAALSSADDGATTTEETEAPVEEAVEVDERREAVVASLQTEFGWSAPSSAPTSTPAARSGPGCPSRAG